MKRILLWATLLFGLLLTACAEKPPVVLKLEVPTDVKVSDLTATSLTLTWSAVEDAQGYEWRCKTSEGYTSGKSAECLARFEELTPESEYQFAVRSTRDDSVSDWSPYVVATTLAVEEPDTPTEPENPNPDTPTEPEDPTEPDTPTEPEEPDTPTEPSEPIAPPVVGNVPLDALIGYGGQTTGGAGGTVHHFNSGTAFRDWLKLREKNKSTEPAVVWLSGTFTKADGRDTGSPWFDIKRTSNITIYGTDSFRMQNVGFFLNEASNIIIRNVYIVQPKADNGADGISMQESRNVWVDHCTFESVNSEKDYEDGSCDVTHATSGVTISWCHYIRTQKSSLVGHSNSASADKDITITMHHNWFEDSNSRHPRVRFGRAHVFNNFYDNVSTYGVGSAYGAMVLVEHNSFDGVRLPIDICTYPAKKSGSSWVSNLTGSVAGYAYAYENHYTNIPADASDPYPFTNVEYTSYGGSKLSTPLTYEDFKPSYDYVVDAADRVPEIVTTGAGVGRLTGYAEAPVAADNGGMGSGEGGSGDGGESGGDTPTTPDTPSEPSGSEVGGGWTLTAVNDSKATCSVAEDGSLTLTALGKFESGAQKFGYVWRKISGDFEATVRLRSYTSEKGGNQSAAGLMLAVKGAGGYITASGTDLLYATSGATTTEYYSHYRLTSGGNASKKGAGTRTSTDNAVLKLVREGEKFTASVSTDGGATFTDLKSDSFAALPEEVYVGLCVSSGDNSKTATAVFEDFAIGGTTYGFK